jgi:type II secretory pathway component GspD/PulD (secretin)
VELIDACAQGLGLVIDYDRSQVQGRVTIRAEEGLDSHDFWALANRLLASKKLASIQASGERALGIVPLADAAKLARIETNLQESVAGYVKVLKTLHYAEPEKAAEVLHHVLSAEGSLVQAVPPARVLLAGLRPQIEEAVDLLGMIDSANPPAIEVVAVRHSTPAAVVTLLERVTKAMEQVSQHMPEGVALADAASGTILVVAPEPEVLWWKERIEGFDQVQPAVTRNYVPRRFDLDETARLVEAVVKREGEGSWRMVEDELTGTLVITATPGMHDEVEALLVRIEAAPPAATNASMSSGRQRITPPISMPAGICPALRHFRTVCASTFSRAAMSLEVSSVVAFIPAQLRCGAVNASAAPRERSRTRGHGVRSPAEAAHAPRPTRRFEGCEREDAH